MPRADSLPLVLLAVTLAGCAPSAPVEPTAGAEVIPATPPSPVRGGHNGLEVRFLPVIEESLVQAELDRITENPLPVSDEVRRQWAAAGLRVYALPASEIERFMTVLTAAPADRMRGGATPMASVTKTWVPQGPMWMEAVRGPAWTSSGGGGGARVIALHDSRLAIGPAPVRLLTRAWTVPTLPPIGDGEGTGGAEGRPGAAVRFEIVPQVLDNAGRPRADPLKPTLRPGEESRGLMLWRLQLSSTLAPGMALVVTTDTPVIPDAAAEARDSQSAAGSAGNSPKDAIGSVERRRSEADGASPPNERVQIGNDPPPPPTTAPAPSGAGPTLGPASGQVPSLGEAMLVYPVAGDQRRRRAVVLFIAHAPRHYTLTGGPAN